MSHWIASSGTPGYLSDNSSVFLTKEEAVESAMSDFADYKEMTGDSERKDDQDAYEKMDSQEARSDLVHSGLHYFEISEGTTRIVRAEECDCNEPWIHEEYLTPFDWLERIGKDVELTDLVDNAVVHLDKVFPSWANHINLEKLSMDHPFYCVIGQLYYYKTETRGYQLGLELFEIDNLTPFQGGSLEPIEWEFVQGVWKDLIADRQSISKIS